MNDLVKVPITVFDGYANPFKKAKDNARKAKAAKNLEVIETLLLEKKPVSQKLYTAAVRISLDLILCLMKSLNRAGLKFYRGYREADSQIKYLNSIGLLRRSSTADFSTVRVKISSSTR